MRHAIRADLPFFHGLEQRALRARAGAVDFVGQQQPREHRAGTEFEFLRRAVEHRYTEDVGRQQVAGELHTLPGQPQHLRQGVRERGLAHTRNVLDEQVAAGQQAGQRQAHGLALAEDDGVQGSQNFRQCTHGGHRKRDATAPI